MALGKTEERRGGKGVKGVRRNKKGTERRKRGRSGKGVREMEKRRKMR